MLKLHFVGVVIAIAAVTLPTYAQEESPSPGIELESAPDLVPEPSSEPGSESAPEPSSESADADAEAEEFQGIDEIIVTANRRSEKLQDVPLSISAIGSEQLASRGVVQTTDLVTLVPNLQQSSTFGDTQPNFSLRGVGAGNEFNANSASPVGVYVDEVYQSFRFAHGQQLYDLDRVEVVRGPQGTLYGRNTTGGAINIITRKPDLGGSNAYLSQGYGNYNRWKLQGGAEITPVEDKVGLRVAFSGTKGDGFFKEVSPVDSFENVSEYGTADSIAARAQLRYKPDDKLDALFKVFVAKDQPVGFPMFAIPSPGATSVDGYSRFSQGLDRDQYDVSGTGRLYTRTSGASSIVTWNGGDNWSLTSVTGLVDGRFSLAYGAIGTPSSLADIVYTGTSTDFNQDLRLNIDTDRFHAVAGVYYGHDSLDVRNTLRFFNNLPDATSAEEFNPGVSSSFNALQQFEQKRDSIAVYGEGTFDVTTALALTVGLRYTDDSIKYVDGNSTVYTDFPGTALFPIFTDVNDKSGSQKVSGRIIGNYRWTDDIRTYASFSRGFRAGTYNGFAYASPTQVYFVKPEQLDAYEVGVKARLASDRLQINAATFFYDYANQQLQEIIGAVGFLRGVDASVKGAELELLAKPVSIVTIRGSVGYLDTKIDKGQLLSGRDIGGNRLPFASNWTFNIGGDVMAAKFDFADLVVSGAATYIGNFYNDVFNKDIATNDELKQAAYTLVDARISLMNPGWSVAAWAKNLTDKNYYTVGYDDAATFGAYPFLPGAPRTYGIEATIRF